MGNVDSNRIPFKYLIFAIVIYSEIIIQIELGVGIYLFIFWKCEIVTFCR